MNTKGILLSRFSKLAICIAGVVALYPGTAVTIASDFEESDYEAGEELYDLGCANCHGKNLVNPGTASFNLMEFPRDDRERFIQSVTRGKGFMPPMGDVFDAEEIEQLWVYISRFKSE